MQALTTTTTLHRVIIRSPFVTLLCVIPALASCQLERLFPADVGAGAARLSVRNAAYLNKLIAGDARCGFAADAVNAAPAIDGDVGAVGSVVWTVEGCEIDFGPAPDEDGAVGGFDFGDDCNGVARHAYGKVRFSATKTVRGVITGNPAQPVIPLENDAAELAYDADLEGFATRVSSASTHATITGRMRAVSEIHLAQSASLGVCGIDTSEITIKSLIVDDALYTVDSGDRVFDADVPHLEAFAQLGNWKDKENFLSGTITVWDTVVDLDDDHVLDPDYDADEFDASYACNDDLLLPVSYACPDLKETVADGAARLVLNDIGNLVSAAVSDARCGFASAAVKDRVRITGDVGYDGGEAVFTIESPCTIELPEDSFLSRNCLGDTTTAGGRGTVKGTMRQRGRVTGDPAQPIIPTSRDAVEIVFEVSFDGWSVQSGTKTFVAESGGASGRMRPRLAKDTTTGACSLPTPVVSFDNVSIFPGTKGVVESDGLAMGVTFREGSINAQAGNKDGDENRLDGSVVVDVLGAEGVAVDVSGALDPAYDKDKAVAAYACVPGLEVPADDADCSFDAVIAENTARLTIQTAGTLASMINGNDDCGFEDTFGVLLWPTEVIGDNGELGSMTWDVADCAVDNDLVEFSSDCAGGVTWVEGDAVFKDAGRTVRGERDKMLLDVVVDSIIPRDRNAVDIELREVQLTEFSSYAVAAGADEPAGVLVIHDGVLSATVQPALGNRADDPTTFDVPTPVARLSSVRLSGSASLYAQGKTFHFTIDDAELTATNGSFLGMENALAGTISVDGKPRALTNLPLNPAYARDAFESSYLCTENLAGPVR